jgi:hypothetical protein
LKFQQISIQRSASWYQAYTYAIADFNGDNRLDLAIASLTRKSINVLLGKGNGDFRTEITSLENQITSLDKMIYGDFNNDNRLDLAGISKYENFVLILIGNGDGTFEKKSTLYLAEGSILSGIAVTYFNSDTYLDIAVTLSNEKTVVVFFGKGDGNFLKKLRLDTGINSYPTDIAVADFNRDGYQDIAVVNQYSRNIVILLGHGNGSFEAPKTSFTGGRYNPIYFVVGDFNTDNLLDIAISYEQADFINVMFGHGNGTVGNSTKFYIGDHMLGHQIFVSDFNGDRYLDIVFADHLKINLFVGDGNGNFEVHRVFSIENPLGQSWLGFGDLNGDGYEDIVYMDRLTDFQYIFLNTCE